MQRFLFLFLFLFSFVVTSFSQSLHDISAFEVFGVGHPNSVLRFVDVNADDPNYIYQVGDFTFTNFNDTSTNNLYLSGAGVTSLSQSSNGYITRHFQNSLDFDTVFIVNSPYPVRMSSVSCDPITRDFIVAGTFFNYFVLFYVVMGHA